MMKHTTLRFTLKSLCLHIHSERHREVFHLSLQHVHCILHSSENTITYSLLSLCTFHLSLSLFLSISLSLSLLRLCKCVTHWWGSTLQFLLFCGDRCTRQYLTKSWWRNVPFYRSIIYTSISNYRRGRMLQKMLSLCIRFSWRHFQRWLIASPSTAASLLAPHAHR